MHHISIDISDNALSLELEGSCTFFTIMAKALEKEKTSTCLTMPQQYTMLVTVLTNWQTIDLEVESSDTLGTILSMIRAKEAIPLFQRTVIFPKLHLFPPPLPFEHDHDHVYYYHMNWKSVPAPATELIQIFVKVYGEEKPISLNVRRSDTIFNVKECIYRTRGIKPFMQKLYFAGMLLKDRVALTDYNIHGEITLDLLFEVSGPMIIYYETKKEEGSLLITTKLTVGEVKSLICKEAGLSLDRPLRLVYAGKRLSDLFTLSNYHVQKEAVLRVVDADDDKGPTTRIQIHVNIVPSEKTISLQARRSDTIHHVKTMIQDMEDGILVHKQILFLTQRRLTNESTLAEYHIKDQSILNLIVYTPEMELYEDKFAVYGEVEG